MSFSADSYRRAARDRLEDAQVLGDSGRWVATSYFAGRAVECHLRALLRIKTDENQSGHDLRSLLKNVEYLRITRPGDADHDLRDAINDIAGIWYNNLRFADEETFKRRIKNLGKDRGIKGDCVKYWAKRLLEQCEMVINRGDILWHRSRKN